MSRRELANAIRALSMDAVQKANSGHPGAPMGMADIAEVLWNDFLKHNPQNPGWVLSLIHICAMAKYLSDRENRADEVAGKKATDKDHLLQQVLFDLVQTDTIKNSLTLGSHILKKIKPVHKLHSRNTEQAAFVVLKSPSIPSVLVETSFITNPNEEKLLGTTAFRQKIATAIANGIISYFHWFDNQKAHSKRR